MKLSSELDRIEAARPTSAQIEALIEEAAGAVPGVGVENSASVCLKDARKALAQGGRASAIHWAGRSLAHSRGTFSQGALRARTMLNAEQTWQTYFGV